MLRQIVVRTFFLVDWQLLSVNKKASQKSQWEKVEFFSRSHRLKWHPGLLEEATVKNWVAVIVTNRKLERFEIWGCHSKRKTPSKIVYSLIESETGSEVQTLNIKFIPDKAGLTLWSLFRNGSLQFEKIVASCRQTSFIKNISLEIWI